MANEVFFLNKGIARTDFLLKAMAETVDVGQLTTKHSPADHITVAIRRGDWKEAIAIVQFAFPFLGKCGTEDYVSPLTAGVDTSGIPYVDMKHALVKEILERGSRMVLNAGNVYRFARDITFLKRMYQEATIDSDKKGGFIFMPYWESLKNVNVMFKKQTEDCFNLIPVWAPEDEESKPKAGFVRKEVAEGVFVDEAVETRSTYVERKVLKTKVKETMFINDFLHQLSLDCFGQAESMAAAFIQAAPNDNWINELLATLKDKFMGDDLFKSLALLCCWYKNNMFVSLTNAEQRALAKVAKQFELAPDEKKARQEQERRVRKQFSPRFEALRNEIRRGLHVFCRLVGAEYSDSLVAEAAIYAAFCNNVDGAPEFVSSSLKANSFAHRVLANEVCIYILKHLRDVEGMDMPLETRDELEFCDETLVGERVKFVEGRYSGAKGAASSDFPFDGWYTISKKGEGKKAKYYISRPLDEALNTKFNPGQMVVVTKCSEVINGVFTPKWVAKKDDFFDAVELGSPKEGGSVVKLKANEEIVVDNSKDLMAYRLPFANAFPEAHRAAVRSIFCEPWNSMARPMAHVEDMTETAAGEGSGEGENLSAFLVFISLS